MFDQTITLKALRTHLKNRQANTSPDELISGRINPDNSIDIHIEAAGTPLSATDESFLHRLYVKWD